MRLANTPRLAALFAKYPHGLIGTSGPDVGLPPGQMGNSEVGHLNFGAGRIAMMDISRIDNAVHDGTLAKNAVIADVRREGEGRRAAACTCSASCCDGGVHSSLAHVDALVDVGARRGRARRRARVPRRARRAAGHRAGLPRQARGAPRGRRGRHRHGRGPLLGDGPRQPLGARASARIDAIVEAEAPRAAQRCARASSAATPPARPTSSSSRSSSRRLRRRRTSGRTPRSTSTSAPTARASSRARSRCPRFDAFARRDGHAPFGGPLRVHDDLRRDASACPSRSRRRASRTSSPRSSHAPGCTQFRCAETEKYAHVTYFFNGGREEPFEGEERKMLPSPKDVADVRPEARDERGRRRARRSSTRDRDGEYDFVLVNFANPDMVGHTGVLDAAIHAVEAVDARRRRASSTPRGREGRRGHRHRGSRQLRADEGSRDGRAAHRAHAQPRAVPLRERRRRGRAACARAGASATSRRRCSSCWASRSPPAMTGVPLLVHPGAD